MSRSLAPPSKELSRRLLQTVPYRDRLPAGRLRPPCGIIPGHVRSLEEVHLLLTPDVRSLPGLNLTALADWVGQVLADTEFAGLIRTAARDAESYAEGCLQVRELIGYRLDQAREIAGTKETLP